MATRSQRVTNHLADEFVIVRQQYQRHGNTSLVIPPPTSNLGL
jgi:hypothetical protein